MTAIQIIDDYRKSPKKYLMSRLVKEGYACEYCHKLLAAGAKCPNMDLHGKGKHHARA